MLRKHWDYWVWLIALVVILVVFFRLLYGRDGFCAGVDEHCFREWMSALSGWAAVVAAIPTVYYLSKQVSDANRNHQQVLALQLDRQTAVASGILHVVEGIDRYLADWEDLTEGRRSSMGYTIEEHAKGLRKLYAQPVMDEFQRDFYFTAPVNLEAIREFLDQMVTAFDGKSTIPNIMLREKMPDFARWKTFSRAVSEAATVFINRRNELVPESMATMVFQNRYEGKP